MQQSYYSSPHGLQGAARFQYPIQQNPSILQTIPTAANALQTNTALTEDLNESEMESDIGSDDDDINDIDSDKLDPSHKEMLEKLKRQEQEERVEIERELKEARRHRDTIRTGDGEEEGDKSTGSSPCCGGCETPGGTEQTEIKMQRPLGLLAQHGLTVKTGLTKTHSNHSLHSDQREYSDKDFQMEREMEREMEHDEEVKREMRDSERLAMTGLDFSTHLSLLDRRFMPSPPPDTPPGCHDPNKPSSTPVGHHWTFEEQFKQLYEMSHEPKKKKVPTATLR